MSSASSPDGSPADPVSAATRHIGLSLGADLCWPMVFEDLLERLDLEIDVEALRPGGDTRCERVRFDVDRVTIEPFELAKPTKYDVIVDRLTHWYDTSREWIKKAVILDGSYVFNNPWSVQSMEKQTSYCAMLRLGMPIPRTILVPPKDYDESADLQRTLQSYARLFDLGQLGKDIGYPLFMKPYDGGGWVGVSKIDSDRDLQDAYDESGKYVMHLQQGIHPYERFVRCIGLGPQVLLASYDPGAPLHNRYQPELDHMLEPDHQQLLRDTVLTINAFFGWDFNSAECLLRRGTWYPIDFANPCPDSQVTSLHVHFPWLVTAKLRWTLFCAATKRPFRHNLNWQPFFDIAATDRPFRDKLRAYGQLAEEHFQAAEFEAFCTEHLPDLDRIAWDYFGSDRAREAVRIKVEALYPEHEHEEFTELFWNRLQDWRHAHRLGGTGDAEADR